MKYQSSFIGTLEVLECEIRKFIEFLEENEGDSARVYKLTLAFEEIGTNIIKYGQKANAECHIQLEYESNGDDFVLKIADDTAPFNPLADAPEPDTCGNLEDRQIGGLGIMLVKKLSKKVTYEFRDQKNHLTCYF